MIVNNEPILTSRTCFKGLLNNNTYYLAAQGFQPKLSRALMDAAWIFYSSSNSVS